MAGQSMTARPRSARLDPAAFEKDQDTLKYFKNAIAFYRMPITEMINHANADQAPGGVTDDFEILTC
jgi:hypothetical protein